MSDREERSPAFQFYPGDFLSDRNVVVMSMHERGLYITLICHAWQSPLPADPVELSRICGVPLTSFRKFWPAVSKCFRDVDGQLVHPRLERERGKQQEYKRRQSDAASKRWQSHGNATASVRHMPKLSQKHATASARDGFGTSQKDALILSSLVLSSSQVGTPTLPERAGAFAEWYADAHEKHIGIGYIGNPRSDYEAALRLCEKFTDAQVQDGALVWFGMDDKWATEGTRTIGKYASRASDCVQRASKVRA
jgi:uncharacterized protein YdaU (DUF1376 family)